MASSSLKKTEEAQMGKEGNYASSGIQAKGRVYSDGLGLTLLPGSQISKGGTEPLEASGRYTPGIYTKRNQRQWQEVNAPVHTKDRPTAHAILSQAGNNSKTPHTHAVSEDPYATSLSRRRDSRIEHGNSLGNDESVAKEDIAYGSGTFYAQSSNSSSKYAAGLEDGLLGVGDGELEGGNKSRAMHYPSYTRKRRRIEIHDTPSRTSKPTVSSLPRVLEGAHEQRYFQDLQPKISGRNASSRKPASQISPTSLQPHHCKQLTRSQRTTTRTGNASAQNVNRTRPVQETSLRNACESPKSITPSVTVRKLNLLADLNRTSSSLGADNSDGDGAATQDGVMPSPSAKHKTPVKMKTVKSIRRHSISESLRPMCTDCESSSSTSLEASSRDDGSLALVKPDVPSVLVSPLTSTLPSLECCASAKSLQVAGTKKLPHCQEQYFLHENYVNPATDNHSSSAPAVSSSTSHLHSSTSHLHSSTSRLHSTTSHLYSSNSHSHSSTSNSFSSSKAEPRSSASVTLVPSANSLAIDTLAVKPRRRSNSVPSFGSISHGASMNNRNRFQQQGLSTPENSPPKRPILSPDSFSYYQNHGPSTAYLAAQYPAYNMPGEMPPTLPFPGLPKYVMPMDEGYRQARNESETLKARVAQMEKLNHALVETGRRNNKLYTEKLHIVEARSAAQFNEMHKHYKKLEEAFVRAKRSHKEETDTLKADSASKSDEIEKLSYDVVQWEKFARYLCEVLKTRPPKSLSSETLYNRIVKGNATIGNSMPLLDLHEVATSTTTGPWIPSAAQAFPGLPPPSIAAATFGVDPARKDSTYSSASSAAIDLTIERTSSQATSSFSDTSAPISREGSSQGQGSHAIDQFTQNLAQKPLNWMDKHPLKAPQNPYRANIQHAMQSVIDVDAEPEPFIFNPTDEELQAAEARKNNVSYASQQQATRVIKNTKESKFTKAQQRQLEKGHAPAPTPKVSMKKARKPRMRGPRETPEQKLARLESERIEEEWKGKEQAEQFRLDDSERKAREKRNQELADEMEKELEALTTDDEDDSQPTTAENSEQGVAEATDKSSHVMSEDTAMLNANDSSAEPEAGASEEQAVTEVEDHSMDHLFEDDGTMSDVNDANELSAGEQQTETTQSLTAPTDASQNVTAPVSTEQPEATDLPEYDWGLDLDILNTADPYNLNIPISEFVDEVPMYPPGHPLSWMDKTGEQIQAEVRAEAMSQVQAQSAQVATAAQDQTMVGAQPKSPATVMLEQELDLFFANQEAMEDMGTAQAGAQAQTNTAAAEESEESVEE